jgi:hypothetical protein
MWQCYFAGESLDKTTNYVTNGLCSYVENGPSSYYFYIGNTNGDFALSTNFYAVPGHLDTLYFNQASGITLYNCRFVFTRIF